MDNSTNTPKKMSIKNHGWHDVVLTGDLLTGDTFASKDWLKKYFDAKWDGNRKGWIVNLDKVEKHSSEDGTSLMVS